MRIHINLRSNHPNQYALLLLIIMSKGKYEWPVFAGNPDFLNPGMRRCRWVRYRMEGGAGPQRHNREMEQ